MGQKDKTSSKGNHISLSQQLKSPNDANEPPPAEVNERQVQKPTIIKFEKKISAFFSILAKLFTVSVIVVAIIFIFRELLNDSYSIQQINVPQTFESAGLSGVVMANLISDNITEIFELLRAQEESAQYIKSSDRSDVEVDMVGLGVPIRGIIVLIGDALGIRKGKKISGDILVTSEKAVLILRCTGHQTESFECDINEKDLKSAANVLVDKASKTILKYTNPMALELYYANVKHDGPNTVILAKFLMENFPDNSEIVRHAYDSWTWGLAYEGKIEEAEKKLIEGLKKFPNDERLYNAWGNILSNRGQDEEAINKYKKVFEITGENGLSKNRMSTMYNNISISYALLGKYDSAINYLQKALRLDKDDWLLYYNIGGVYLLEKDTASFYEYIQRSLDLGADVEMIRKDPDIKPMMAEKRMLELLAKYK